MKIKEKKTTKRQALGILKEGLYQGKHGALGFLPKEQILSNLRHLAYFKNLILEKKNV